VIRTAAPGDVPAIHRLIRELADYERSLDQVQVTEEGLRTALFGPEPLVFAHIAEHEGSVAGFALWFVNFSTWSGKHGIYLEDLYVTPGSRKSGLGRALVAELAGLCVQRGYARLEWAVLDWNTPAMAFYASIGAVPLDGWSLNRLSGPALQSLAQRGSAS
jgi:GNAT superfamily N-acetyltransferase